MYIYIYICICICMYTQEKLPIYTVSDTALSGAV